MAELLGAGDCVRLVAAELRAGSAVVLKDVDVSFEAGQVHAVVGSNGSGKTTLLRALAGDEVAGVAGLWWFGANARALSAREQARVRASVFGDPIPALSSSPSASTPRRDRMRCGNWPCRRWPHAQSRTTPAAVLMWSPAGSWRGYAWPRPWP
ncbi:MAG: ATP-binding cassette domain-containing protein [Proteobacteria bacterium]|nr:ATP-binding cassette domain-containing protein [Pseudomonadota bacterium]